jgi:hypothetical protein
VSASGSGKSGGAALSLGDEPLVPTLEQGPGRPTIVHERHVGHPVDPEAVASGRALAAGEAVRSDPREHAARHSVAAQHATVLRLPCDRHPAARAAHVAARAAAARFAGVEPVREALDRRPGIVRADDPHQEAGVRVDSPGPMPADHRERPFGDRVQGAPVGVEAVSPRGAIALDIEEEETPVAVERRQRVRGVGEIRQQGPS